MATDSWGTYRGRDEMWPPKLGLSRSIGRRIMTFRIFSNMAALRHFEFKKIIFDHVTVIVVLICCCVPNLMKIGSRVRPPDAHNCWMYNAPLLGNGCCQASAVAIETASWGTCLGHDGMQPPKCYLNRSIDRGVIAFPTFCNIAAVRHLEYEFCYGPPTKSTMRFDYPVKIWYRSDIPRRRYYNFIILPFWLENV